MTRKYVSSLSYNRVDRLGVHNPMGEMDTYGHKGGRVNSYNEDGCDQTMENTIGENGHIWTQRRKKRKRARKRVIGPSSDRVKKR